MYIKCRYNFSLSFILVSVHLLLQNIPAEGFICDVSFYSQSCKRYASNRSDRNENYQLKEEGY